MLLMSFPLFTSLEETHQWGNYVSAEYTFNNTTLAFLPPPYSSLPASAPPDSMMKRPGGGPQPCPINLRPAGQVHRSHFPPPPHISLFHTRHAEESAERPHLVTIVRPCGQSTLRKVNLHPQFQNH